LTFDLLCGVNVTTGGYDDNMFRSLIACCNRIPIVFESICDAGSGQVFAPFHKPEL